MIHANSVTSAHYQLPANLISEFGSPLNKGHIYLARTRPKSMLEAYLDLFKRDMTLFLKSRSEELVPGGSMMFTMAIYEQEANMWQQA